MKKNIIILIAVLAVPVLIGCKNDPIEPKIIGTTFLQEEKGVIFAEFDSVRYVPTKVYTREKIGKVPSIENLIRPINGMQVTCFTSKIHKEPTFFAGQATVAEIEDYFYQVSTPTILIILGLVIGILIFAMIIHAITSKEETEVGVVNAHA